MPESHAIGEHALGQILRVEIESQATFQRAGAMNSDRTLQIRADVEGMRVQFEMPGLDL